MYPNSSMTRTRGPARESASLVPSVMHESNAGVSGRPAREEMRGRSGVQDGVEVEHGAEARLEGAGAEILRDAAGLRGGGGRPPRPHPQPPPASILPAYADRIHPPLPPPPPP